MELFRNVLVILLITNCTLLCINGNRYKTNKTNAKVTLVLYSLSYFILLILIFISAINTIK